MVFLTLTGAATRLDGRAGGWGASIFAKLPLSCRNHPGTNTTPQENCPGTTGRPEPLLVEFVISAGVMLSPTLDIGAGTGTNAIWLAERSFDVLGVDVSPLASKEPAQNGDPGIALPLRGISGFWLSLIGSTEGPPARSVRRAAREITLVIEPAMEMVELRSAEFRGSEAKAWFCLSRHRTISAQSSSRHD